MNLASVVSNIKDFLGKNSTPANTLPPILLKAAAHNRSGISAYKIASKIIENNKNIGIPTGENPDGSPNMINEYTYNVVKSVIESLKEDASIQVVIPAGSLKIISTGANAGGLVESTGTNQNDTIGKGIIQ